MVLVNVGVHFKHVQIIRFNIGPESAKKCGDVENEPISEKKSSGYALRPTFQTPPYFIKSEYCIYKV
jgi:hypothetical protein